MEENEEKKLEKKPEEPEKRKDLKSLKSMKLVLEEKGIKGHFDAVGSPLKSLPSLLATAIILSYYSHQKEVTILVKQLNKQGQRYFLNHQQLLKAFIAPSVLTKHPFFGSKGKIDVLDAAKNQYFEWPTQEQYDGLPGVCMLKSLNFKAGNFKSLSGIQIVLTNGNE